MSRQTTTWKQRVALAVLALSVPAAASAALRAAGTPEVSFIALGPAGLHIVGTTHDLSVVDDATNITVKVPLDGLKTGIGLRDNHMKEHLDVQHFRYATLTTQKTALHVPGATGVKSTAHGKLMLHGKTRDTVFTYTAAREEGGIHVDGTMRVNMNDYGISVPSYLGVTVRPDVDIAVHFGLVDR